MAVSSHSALADEVLFNNGDRLTGEVLSVDGGKLKIQTTVAGEVVVDLKDVKTFNTEKPVDVRTKSGDRINAPIASAGTAGEVTIQPEGGPRTMPLSEVKYLNYDETWTGAVIAGALFNRGNTFSDDINVSFDATKRRENDRWTFTGGYNFGRERNPDTGDKTTSTDNWFATGKYDYFLSEKLYVFGAVRYEHDRIAELDYRLVPGVGVGYFWIDRPDLKFDTEAGLAYLVEKYDDGGKDESISGRLAYHLKKSFNGDQVSLFHNTEYFPSFQEASDFLVVSDAGIRTAITARMFAEYKFEYRYDATPADDQHKSDLRHILGLGWKF
jgi:putative salt-induced outer membrane protein YdiY